MTDQLPKNAGVIVALLPSEEYTRMRPTTKDHHTTVVMLGKYDDPQITEERLEAFWTDLQRLWTWTIKAETTADAAFVTEDGWAHVDLVNGPFLPDFRSIVQELLDLHGLPLDRRFGFMPHITRRYIKSNQNALELVHYRPQVSFWYDRVALWQGDTRREYELQ